jgi:hypothetical protein
MKRPLRGGLVAGILALAIGSMLAGCVVVPAPDWHHGYWYRGHTWYR